MNARREVFPMNWNQWVNDNNPSRELQYGKGWWDYIEIVRRITGKFGIENVQVVATYTMHTPPPKETLFMPVLKFGNQKANIIIKNDFGNYPETFTCSIDLFDNALGEIYHLFDPARDLRTGKIDGFQKDWVYEPYSINKSRFTFELIDEWDLMTMAQLIFHDSRITYP